MNTSITNTRNSRQQNKQFKGGMKAPIRTLGSNFSMVEQSMLIEPDYNKKHWSNMRRVPHSLKIAREIENYKNEIALATGRAGITGITKSFVVFKKVRNKFVPIGVGAKNRRFSKWESAKQFVREMGRTHAKCGPIISDVTK